MMEVRRAQKLSTLIQIECLLSINDIHETVNGHEPMVVVFHMHERDCGMDGGVLSVLLMVCQGQRDWAHYAY